MADRDKSFILWFKELGMDDVPLAGGKNASLGEMYQNMAEKGVAVPNGFAITAYAYEYFLEQTGVKQEIENILQALSAQDGCDLARMSGSGSCCFGLFESAELAKRAADDLTHDNPDWWVCATTLGRVERY